MDNVKITLAAAYATLWSLFFELFRLTHAYATVVLYHGRDVLRYDTTGLPVVPARQRDEDITSLVVEGVGEVAVHALHIVTWTGVMRHRHGVSLFLASERFDAPVGMAWVPSTDLPDDELRARLDAWFND